MTEPLWQPTPARVAETNLTRFIKQLEADLGLSFADYEALYDWSIANIEGFWKALWKFSAVVAENDGPILVEGDRMPGAAFYPEAKVNFAENLLRRRDEADAIVFWGEDKVKRRLSHGGLYDQVSRLAQALQAEGVGPGDRVAGFMPNMPETSHRHPGHGVASARSGAPARRTSASRACSTASDRSSPRCSSAPTAIAITARLIDSLARVADFHEGPAEPTRRIVVVPYLSARPRIWAPWGQGAVALGRLHLAPYPCGMRSPSASMPFNSPLYIMYSSGTTGSRSASSMGHRRHAVLHPLEGASSCSAT